MAIADNRQRKMPLPEDRLGKRGRPLAYPEAVLLVHPVEDEFKGEVDDKYEYSSENKDLKVHGWISHNLDLGCWQIIPSNEFRSGGLSKQNLTSHVGPISLAVCFFSLFLLETCSLIYDDGFLLNDCVNTDVFECSLRG